VIQVDHSVGCVCVCFCELLNQVILYLDIGMLVKFEPWRHRSSLRLHHHSDYCHLWLHII